MSEDVTPPVKPDEQLEIICQKYDCKYECPVCGQKIPFFLQRKSRSPIVKCPVCGALIKKSDVPREAILTAPTAYDMIGKASIEEIIDQALKDQEATNDIEEEGHEEETVEQPVKPSPTCTDRTDRSAERKRKGVVTENLFYQPKSPCDVLAEILDEFAFINEDFKTFILRRCERKGFLHPIELLTLLQRMKSGIRTKDEAGIIAEEYAVALQRELEKAQREGVTYPFLSNIYIPENVPVTDPYVQRLLQILPPHLQPESLRQDYGRTPQQHGGAFGYQPHGYIPSYSQHRSQQSSQPVVVQTPNINLAPIVEMVKATQETFMQQQNLMIQQQQQTTQLMMQMMQQQTQLLLQSLQQSLQNALQPIGEGMRALAEAIKEIKQQPQQGMPLNDKIIELIKESAESKAQVQFYQKVLEMKDKQVEDIKQIVADVMSRVEDLVKKTVSVPTGEFKSDEAKIIAQALTQVAQVGHRVVDALDKRQPVKIIVEALPYLTGAGKPKPKRYEKAETGTEIIKELEEAGLVEE